MKDVKSKRRKMKIGPTRFRELFARTRRRNNKSRIIPSLFSFGIQINRTFFSSSMGGEEGVQLGELFV
jgi:hypothetical protein